MNKGIIISLLLCSFVLLGADAPKGWGEFQIGTVNNNRSHWDVPMRAAITKYDSIVNRRYLYIDDTLNYVSYWGDGKNWSQDSFYVANNIGSAITVYMLQRGGDSFSAITAGINDKNFMTAYFKYLGMIVNKSKGTDIAPIYVLEPDVWTYILQKTREENNDKSTWNSVRNNHLDDFCHINDLGYPWLEEFDNRLGDLPGAIIKTIKYYDPKSYAGTLIGFWGWKPTGSTSIGYFGATSEQVADGAIQASIFLDSLLNGTPYRGDFAGIEKNGTDEGDWTSQGNAYGDYLRWDDRQNRDWINFAKIVSQKVNLPLVGWQIAIGNPSLPNTPNAYTDTFFPYFFTHFQDYLDAGFVGMMAGVANRDNGTIPVPEGYGALTAGNGGTTMGDEGWFYKNLDSLNQTKPFLTDNSIYHTIIAEVLTDTIKVSDSYSEPDWDASTTYNTPDTKVVYGGKLYKSLDWFTKGDIPSDSPREWGFISLSGTWEFIDGGSVYNNNVYYEEGKKAVHYFNPKGIVDYGIDFITVNGDTIANTSSYTVEAIDKDYLIKVKFKKGGEEVSINSNNPKNNIKLSTIINGNITVTSNSKISIYNLLGKRVLLNNLKLGDSLSPMNLPRGVYIANISSNGLIENIKINIK